MAFYSHAQTGKVLTLKKDGRIVYSMPLEWVKELNVTDGWDHLGSKGNSLFREMLLRPELSRFVQAVRSAGYEFALDMPNPDPNNPSFYYSVVAPTNNVLESLSQEDIQDSIAMRKLVRCYIACYDIEGTEQVRFLSNKTVKNTYVNPIQCHNGSLYSTSKSIQAPLYLSDLLSENRELSWFYDQISPYDMPYQGSEVNLKEDQCANVQLDFAQIGNHSTALVPTNQVYDAFLSRNGCYFDSKDTFTEKYKPAPWAGNPMARLMAIEGRYTSYEEMPAILTIQATGRKIAKEQLNIGEPIVTDSAVVFPLYELPYTLDDIYSSICTEAENEYRLYEVGTNMSVSSHVLETDTLSISPLSTDYKPSTKYAVSGGNYQFIKQSVNRCATVTYGVVNTLAGAYDVWVTFIPGSMVKGIEPGSASVNGFIKYCVANDQGIQIETQDIVDFKVDPYAVTRVRVAENLNLGVCFDGFLQDSEYLYTEDVYYAKKDLLGQKYGFSLTLKNSTRLAEMELDHNLYIDCIELVPHKVK